MGDAVFREGMQRGAVEPGEMCIFGSAGPPLVGARAYSLRERDLEPAAHSGGALLRAAPRSAPLEAFGGPGAFAFWFDPSSCRTPFSRAELASAQTTHAALQAAHSRGQAARVQPAAERGLRG